MTNALVFGHSSPFLGGNLKNIAPFEIRRQPVCAVQGLLAAQSTALRGLSLCHCLVNIGALS
jgi:hypothetical protein